MNKKYLFQSKRLGFRNWLETDLDQLAAINADPEVMEHFPTSPSREETKQMILRFQNHYADKGYTYFAVEVLGTGEWIGFIGLMYQEYEAPFTPATDIGWRLKKPAWGMGYATEGAQRCLEYAFDTLKLNRVVSLCTVSNSKSESVMKKIGMVKQEEFILSKLKAYPDYASCVWYEMLTKG